MQPFALPARPVVAVVAPASSAQPSRLDAGAAVLQARGWELRFGASARGKHPPYFSAGAAERLHDLHAAFTDPEVDAIQCTRGGYGCNYLLPGLDLDLIRANPKPLFGYSDMTALQTYLLDRTGLIAFHAPLLAGDWSRPDGVDEASFDAVLSGGTPSYSEGLHVLRPGTARGTLSGGCLSILTSLLGTSYAPATEGKLLFLEDVGVKPYQIDRMLRQMVLAGKLRGVSGIVFGEMLDCTSPGARPELLEEAILHALGDFPGPVAIGLRSGHVSRANITVPFGVEAVLEAGAAGVTLTLHEPAVRVRS